MKRVWGLTVEISFLNKMRERFSKHPIKQDAWDNKSPEYLETEEDREYYKYLLDEAYAKGAPR